MPEREPWFCFGGSVGPHRHVIQPERAFTVDDVTPAGTPVWSETLNKCVARRFQRRILLLPDATKAVHQSGIDEMPKHLRGRDAIGSTWHPLIEAVHCAFSRHYPLTLSPDAIWPVIAQGFSHHINEHAETFRHRLVRHQGRTALTAKIAPYARHDHRWLKLTFREER